MGELLGKFVIGLIVGILIALFILTMRSRAIKRNVDEQMKAIHNLDWDFFNKRQELHYIGKPIIDFVRKILDRFNI